MEPEVWWYLLSSAFKFGESSSGAFFMFTFACQLEPATCSDAQCRICSEGASVEIKVPWPIYVML
jgi:hypothetical protein